jgi:hypothetical protein
LASFDSFESEREMTSPGTSLLVDVCVHSPHLTTQRERKKGIKRKSNMNQNKNELDIIDTF